ncbi:MAG TPA: FAD binding domain-containing protein [Candidatus Paceibacterota bacterium]|nr:FAD binding domain-containing protein [Verrucomicrobiota bacterium]HRY46696.1 FAD binding domain-containing protein [Candidatus Paceibacterota bacterium]
MILQPFEYRSVDSLKSADALIQKHGKRATVIAGGTDLLGTLKDAIHSNPPELLIGLKPLTGLRYVNADANGIRIGSLTPLADIARHPVIRQTYPLLAEAALSVASPQIRNVATLAGNLCQEPRCWYYRNPENTFDCLRKGGKTCDALFAENRFHSIFGGRCVNAAPCAMACPIHNDIPAYMARIRAGEVHEATSILLKTNPLPAVTGRVCPHTCETDCNRFGYDEPVSIRDVERFLGDYALEHARDLYRPPAMESGKRVAIVGSGPAGLTAAYFLRQAGHAITVLDQMPEAGGMLTYSIPAYRMPKNVMAAQVRALEAMGIRFELGTALGGAGASLGDLRQRFEAMFLATGLWTGKALKLEKAELLDSGLKFLIGVQLGGDAQPKVGKRVLVIGGGSVAVDVALTARRLGATKVSMACLESLNSMPAISEDVDQALEEGIDILPSWGPHRVLEQNGKLAGMELVRCTSVFDQEGRFAPSFDSTVTTTVQADQVLVAIGQAADLSYAEPWLNKERGLLRADKATGATTMPGVFAGGDVTGSSATIVQAMASGQRIAASIDAHLTGVRSEPQSPSRVRLNINKAALTPSNRTHVPRLPAGQRSLLSEDCGALSLGLMESEANRCANCGCVAVNASDLAPALIALHATVKTTRRRLPAEDFFSVAVKKTTVLEPGELIEEIEIPAPPPGTHQAYSKFRIRNAIDFPIVSVAFRAELRQGKFHDARMVLGAVAPVPVVADKIEALLEGREPSDALAQEAATIAVQDAQPLARNPLKVEVLKTLVKKAILRLSP